MDGSESRRLLGIQIKWSPVNYLLAASNMKGIYFTRWMEVFIIPFHLRTTLICKAWCRFMGKNAIANDRWHWEYDNLNLPKSSNSECNGKYKIQKRNYVYKGINLICKMKVVLHIDQLINRMSLSCFRVKLRAENDILFLRSIFSHYWTKDIKHKA